MNTTRGMFPQKHFADHERHFKNKTKQNSNKKNKPEAPFSGQTMKSLPEENVSVCREESYKRKGWSSQRSEVVELQES